MSVFEEEKACCLNAVEGHEPGPNRVVISPDPPTVSDTVICPDCARRINVRFVWLDAMNTGEPAWHPVG